MIIKRKQVLKEVLIDKKTGKKYSGSHEMSRYGTMTVKQLTTTWYFLFLPIYSNIEIL